MPGDTNKPNNGFTPGEQALIREAARQAAQEVLQTWPGVCPKGIANASAIQKLQLSWAKLTGIAIGVAAVSGGMGALVAKAMMGG